jgi:bifunctional oligoribonuclease and PAP phosphatase NrnA
MIDKQLVEAAHQLINKAERILVSSHIRPDGDAIGSVLALGLALIDKGKQVVMTLDDGVPSRFHFLEGYDKVVNQVSGSFDLVIVLDCGEFSRVGSIAEKVEKAHINIDHHPANPHFGEINLIDPTATSVSEMLVGLIPAFGLEINKAVADALLTGMITDTLGFKTPNMKPETLRLAADLFDKGANLPYLYDQALTRKSFEAVRYWGAGLSQLQRDGRIIWTTLSLADRKLVGYHGRDDADLISLLSSITNVDVALIFVQQSENEVKVSWRANNGFNVAQIAQVFGGGGHAAAAGATVQGDLEGARQEVLKVTKEFLAV